MDKKIVRFVNLPTKVRAYTIRDEECDFNIYINARISNDQQLAAYDHEIKHIKNGDFNKEMPVGLIEIHAHRK